MENVNQCNRMLKFNIRVKALGITFSVILLIAFPPNLGVFNLTRACAKNA
jgi:hypothetical protein